MPAGRIAKRLRWALVLTGVAVVLLALVTGWQALRAKHALESVAADFETLGDQMAAGDREGARETLEAAQDHAASARANTHGPGWWVGARVPGVGANVRTVRTVADVVDNLAVDVLPRVVDATATLQPANLRPRNGRVDLDPISAVAPDVVTADRLLQVEAERVTALDTRHLLSRLAGPVRDMQAKVARAAELSDRVSRAVRLLPPMLGAGGPRSYLLLFQNNAEPRATGGIPGSFAVVNVRDGRIGIGRQGDAQTIGRFDEPPLPLTRDERVLFGDKLGQYPQDVNFTPDFPRSAELIRAMWNARQGLQVDGVASADPVALSYLLRGTGPLRVAGDRELTAGNAVRTLLSDAYAEIPEPALQNVFFASVAKKVFEAVAAGQGEPREVLRGLAQGASEHRILLWSSRAAEQRLIEPTALSGALAHRPTTDPHVGVFLNDGTGNKMGYFLDHRVDVTPVRCQGERQVLDVRLTLSSSAPRRGTGLPDYVAASAFGVPRGTMRVTVSGYAPVGGYVDSMEIDGEPLEVVRRDHDGRSLTQATVDVAPGARRTVQFTMYTGAGQPGNVVLRSTPGVNGSGVGTVGQPACR